MSRHPQLAILGFGTMGRAISEGLVEAGGYTGWYDLEILSDNGLFGNDYPDSLWKLPPANLVKAARTRCAVVLRRLGPSLLISFHQISRDPFAQQVGIKPDSATNPARMRTTIS